MKVGKKDDVAFTRTCGSATSRWRPASTVSSTGSIRRLPELLGEDAHALVAGSRPRATDGMPGGASAEPR